MLDDARTTIIVPPGYYDPSVSPGPVGDDTTLFHFILEITDFSETAPPEEN